MGTERTSSQLVRGGVWAILSKGVITFSALILNVLLTRLLPPESVGAYYLAASIVFLLAIATQCGVHQGVVRLVAGGLGVRDEGAPRRVIRAAVLLVGTATLIVSLAYGLGVGRWLGAYVFDSALVGDAAGLIAVWIALRAAQTLISQIFRSFHQIGYASLFEGSSTSVLVVALLASLWMAQASTDLSTVLIVTLVALFVSVVSGGLLLARHYGRTQPARGVDLKPVLAKSMPLFVVSIAIPGLEEAHVWLLGALSSEAEVALYGSAYRVAKLLVIPLLIVNSVIPPMVAQLMAQNRTGDVERILRATAFMAGLPTIVALAIVIFAGPGILTLLFGEYYAGAATPLLILALGQSINVLTGSPGILLSMSDHQSTVMKAAVVAGTIGLLASAVLVEPFGATGVAVGVALGLAAHNGAMWAYCRYRLGIRTHMALNGPAELLQHLQKVASRSG